MRAEDATASMVRTVVEVDLDVGAAPKVLPRLPPPIVHDPDGTQGV